MESIKLACRSGEPFQKAEESAGENQGRPAGHGSREGEVTH